MLDDKTLPIAVAQALYDIFPLVNIYFEQSAQTPMLPAFYIDITSCTSRHKTIDAIYKTYTVKIEYYHSDNEIYKQELLNTQSQLYDTVSVVSIDSKKVKGVEISNNIIGDVIRYVVAYDIMVKPTYEGEMLEDVVVNGEISG